jgi:hypothetical protein
MLEELGRPMLTTLNRAIPSAVLAAPNGGAGWDWWRRLGLRRAGAQTGLFAHVGVGQ